MAQVIDLDLIKDEKVMQCAIDRMADLGQVIAAVYRLSANPDYARAVADLAIARRTRNANLANESAAEIMWLVEDEILAQCRREQAQGVLQ